MIPQPELPGVSHRYVQVGDVKLHVAELGDPAAPPLVLLHGWPQHWWCWRRVAPELAGEFRCLMPDLRGHGWSDGPASGYDKEQLASDLLGLLDELGLERVGYIGHDWGGWTGMLAAIREPARFKALLAVGIAHPWPSRHDRLSPKRLAALTYQLPLSAPFAGQRLARAGITRRILERSAPEGTYSADDLEAFDAPMRTDAGARATTLLYRAFVTREAPALLRGRYKDAHLEPETRLLVGTKDLIAWGSDMLGFEENAPRMTLEWVEGAGHFLPEERPDVVVRHARKLFGRGL